MAFHDIRFPVSLSFGSVGGPERRTDIVTLSNGFEERNTPWAHSRRRYDAGLGLRSLDDVAAVIARGATLGREHLPPPLPAAPGADQPTGAAGQTGGDLATADARLQEAVRAWVGAQLGAATPREGWLHEDFLKAAEAALISEVLVRTEGNRTAAARILGLDRATLRGKLPRG